MLFFKIKAEKSNQKESKIMQKLKSKVADSELFDFFKKMHVENRFNLNIPEDKKECFYYL